MKYTISYQNPTLQYVPITLEFDTRGKSEFTLQFPAWRPGRYELGNFAKNVRNLNVFNSENKKCAFHKTSKDTWQIHAGDTETVKISYTYYAAELNAGSTYMDDRQLYVNPVNCLAYLPERQEEPCTLQLHLPENFEIACGAKHESNCLLTSSYHELVDSPFIASAELKHDTYTILDRTFHLWFQGDITLDWERLKADFEKFTQSQIEHFSDRRAKFVGFSDEDYHFLFQILPYKAYHGVEHSTSTVISLGPTEEIFKSLYDELLGVSSHELYHVWNIKSIRPAEMYPYRYNEENHSHLGYVAEGVTTYLGDVFLSLSGVKSFEWYKSEIEKLLQRHFDNFGRFNYSVAESSWDTWLDGYVKGAPFRKVSIYNEGALLAFAMDMLIRRKTENKKSIHDVMYTLYRDFALKSKGYTEGDYKAICEAVSGISLDYFWDNFFHGTNPYESILRESFETIGFTLEMKPNPDLAQRILGIKYLVSEETTIIQDIYPGSTAEIGQLMIGDKVLSLNGKAVAGDINAVLKTFEDRPLEIEIERMGRKINLICPNTNREIYPIYFIQKEPIPSNLSKRIFKKWSGHSWDEV